MGEGPGSRLHRGLNSLRPAAVLAAVYGVFVAVGLFELAFGPARFVDLEELDYGTLPFAASAGIFGLTDWFDYRLYDREGALVLVTPLVTPFFLLGGASLAALKVAGVAIAGIWAVVWAAVARRVFPGMAAWKSVVLFAVPLPLVQMAALSIVSMMTHLGSSTWHGLALLCAVLALDSPSALRSRIGVLTSGMLGGIGTFCAYSALPLLPGVAWYVWARGGRARAGWWLLGTLPGLLWAWGWFHTEALEDVERSSSTLAFVWSTASQVFLFGPGVANNDALLHTPWDGASYCAAGVVALLLVVEIVLMVRVTGLHAARLRSRVDPLLARALGLSALGYLASMVLTRYEMSPDLFDGLRYLLPLAPLYTLICLAVCHPLPRRLGAAAVVGFVLLHLAGVLQLTYPFQRVEGLSGTRGFHAAPVLFATTDRSSAALESPYASELALWTGMRLFHEDSTLQQHPGFHAWTDSPHADEFWRGVGIAMGHAGEPASSSVAVPPRHVHHVRQGEAMGFDCASARSWIDEHEPDSDILWALGRSSRWWQCDDDVYGDLTDRDSFRAGRREGWVLDFGLSTSPPTQSPLELYAAGYQLRYLEAGPGRFRPRWSWVP